MNDALLAVRDVHIHFSGRQGTYRAVNGVSFDLQPGEILGLVGETGSGKSVTLRAILNLVPFPGRLVAGDILYQGQSLLGKSEAELRAIRGKEIALVLQNARAALNPFLTLGEQLVNVYRAHHRASRLVAHNRAIEVLKAVQMPDPVRRASAYPHELSGGMAQRALIAMGLVCSPRVLLADEPTTALDVTTQAQILSVFRQLVKDEGISTVLVTHDLGLVQRYCDRVAVMFAGQVVEVGQVRDIFEEPRHPYTISLLRSIGLADWQEQKWPPAQPLSLLALPYGCRFQDRCPWAQPLCRENPPPEVALSEGHAALCHFTESVRAASH